MTGHTIVGVNVAHKTLVRVNDRSHNSWRQCRTQHIGGLMTGHKIVGVDVAHKTLGD